MIQKISYDFLENHRSLFSNYFSKNWWKIKDPKWPNDLRYFPWWNHPQWYISSLFIVSPEPFFVGVEEDEVDTLDYPMDRINWFFDPLDESLRQILANQILHQDIFATFCVRGVFNWNHFYQYSPFYF